MKKSLFLSRLVQFVLLGLLLGLLLAGCSSYSEALSVVRSVNIFPGESAQRTVVTCFYIANSADTESGVTYFPLKPETFDLIKSDPVWTTPAGVEMGEKTSITLSPATITWNNNAATKQLSVEGILADIAYQVTGSAAAVPGKGPMSLTLPNLALLAEGNVLMVQTNCRGKPGQAAEAGKLSLPDVNVYASKAELDKAQGNSRLWGCGGLAVVIIALVVGWAVIKSKP